MSHNGNIENYGEIERDWVRYCEKYLNLATHPTLPGPTQTSTISHNITPKWLFFMRILPWFHPETTLIYHLLSAYYTGPQTALYSYQYESLYSLQYETWYSCRYSNQYHRLYSASISPDTAASITQDTLYCIYSGYWHQYVFDTAHCIYTMNTKMGVKWWIFR